MSSVVSLENVDIRRNEATCGGGVYSPLDSDLVIVNSLLDSNVASISGGGLYTNASISCKIYDSVFRNIFLRVGVVIICNNRQDKQVINNMMDTFCGRCAAGD